MNVKKITLLLVILICGLSCSDSHTEPDENENGTTTIYDLFPKYSHYEHLYSYQIVILENTLTGEMREFQLNEKGKLTNEINSEWRMPNDAPYFYNEYFGVIRLIRTNEVCYKEAFEIFPNYFYYECLLSIKKLYELDRANAS